MVGSLLRAGESILEIGCGHGETLSYLTERYRLGGYAVEPSDEAIAYLKESHPTIEVVARSIEELIDNEEFAGKFDLILISHCLENILDVNRALITVRNLLSKSGHLYIDTPNLYWSGGMNPYHPFVFTPETLCAFLGKHGFTVRKINASKKPVGLIRDSLRSRKRWFNLLAVKGTSEIQPRHSDHEDIKHAFEISRRILALDAQMRRLKKTASRAGRIWPRPVE
jgi:SAM-dependent methyltransferase